MAEEKKEEIKQFIVPLRRKFINTPQYKRVPKAIKALKKFIAKHMKIRDGDFSKIKIDKYLNEEFWFRGIRKPPHKIKVNVKREGEKILVELAEFSERAKWKKEREKKGKEETKKKKELKKAEKEEAQEKEAEKEEKKEEMKEEVEKEKSVVEAGIKDADRQARESKHETKVKQEPKHKFRQALQK